MSASQQNEHDVPHEMHVAQRLLQDGATDDESGDARELRLFEAAAATADHNHNHYNNNNHNDDHNNDYYDGQ